MKACPGLRSGIDRSGSLSFAAASLRQSGPPSSIRPPIRHSGEGRNPGGAGRGKTTRRRKKPTPHPIFNLLCGLRKAIGDSGANALRVHRTQKTINPRASWPAFRSSNASFASYMLYRFVTSSSSFSLPAL